MDLAAIFGGGIDLAALASGAGLGAGVLGAIAALAFRGPALKFIARLLIGSSMTGVGFLALLNVMGYEIVPREGGPTQFSMPSINLPEVTVGEGQYQSRSQSQWSDDRQAQGGYNQYGDPYGQQSEVEAPRRSADIEYHGRNNRPASEQRRYYEVSR